MKTSHNLVSFKQIAGGIILTSVALFFNACAVPEQPEPLEQPEPPAPQGSIDDIDNRVSVKEIIDNTNKYVGQTVTVTGNVEDIVAENIFRLEDSQLLNSNKEILVLSINSKETADTSKNAIRKDRQLEVTGEVRQLVLSDIEKDYNLTLDKNVKQKIETEYAGKPVLVVKTTRTVSD